MCLIWFGTFWRLGEISNFEMTNFAGGVFLAGAFAKFEISKSIISQRG